MQVSVRDNNVDQALRALKKKLQREGVFREMKLKQHFEKPSEKKAREKAEAIRRARKLARKKAQREGLAASGVCHVLGAVFFQRKRTEIFQRFRHRRAECAFMRHSLAPPRRLVRRFVRNARGFRTTLTARPVNLRRHRPEDRRDTARIPMRHSQGFLRLTQGVGPIRAPPLQTR
jgi:small subunit ribosomal protein S21